ncbi:MAG TPA: cytochrome c biogenesis CcdA family protein [Steroidobacteraceae bacterium]|nr:cytochrome c biogenesis CcdA family protein [Steroidobacteraceae bacterium]
MSFGAATYGLGLIAGSLSTLSPCVLPLVPVLIASAVNAHRWGALALGAGLALSFAVIGIFLATVGASLGLDPDTFRTAGAVILAIFGLILLVPKLQNVFATATGALSNSGNELMARVTFEGFPGQFLIGLLLGIVWSPCVGPTLGAATTLASQGRDLGQIGLLMLIFGIGAAAPLVLLGSLSRSTLMKVRGRLLNAGKVGKQAFGFAMLSLGVLIATGLDKSVEAWVLDRTPDWLTAVTTRF